MYTHYYLIISIISIKSPPLIFPIQVSKPANLQVITCWEYQSSYAWKRFPDLKDDHTSGTHLLFITLIPPLRWLRKEEGELFQTLGGKVSEERLHLGFMLFLWKEPRLSWCPPAQLQQQRSQQSSAGWQQLKAGGKSNIRHLASISRETASNVFQVHNALPSVGSSQPVFSCAHSGGINTFCSCRQPLMPKPTQYEIRLNSFWYTLWRLCPSWLWLQSGVLLLDGRLLDEPFYFLLQLLSAAAGSESNEGALSPVISFASALSLCISMMLKAHVGEPG